MQLFPLAQTMLFAAYVRQFGEGEQLDWQAWSAAAGHDRVEARRAASDLRGRNLAIPAAGRLRVTTAGAEYVERHGHERADLTGLVVRQYDLRRRILRTLEQNRTAADGGDRAPGGEAGPPALPPAPGPGLWIEQITEAVGECAGTVASAVLLLKDAFLLQAETRDPGETGPLRFRISPAGRRALPSVRPAWPLSPDVEGTGNRRQARW